MKMLPRRLLGACTAVIELLLALCVCALCVNDVFCDFSQTRSPHKKIRVKVEKKKRRRRRRVRRDDGKQALYHDKYS